MIIKTDKQYMSCVKPVPGKTWCETPNPTHQGGAWVSDGHRAHWTQATEPDPDAADSAREVFKGIVPSTHALATLHLDVSPKLVRATPMTKFEKSAVLEPFARETGAFEAWPDERTRCLLRVDGTSAYLGDRCLMCASLGRAKVAVNPRYLLDAIKELPCVIELRGECDPIVVKGSGWMSIVMPVRQ